MVGCCIKWHLANFYCYEKTDSACMTMHEHLKRSEPTYTKVLVDDFEFYIKEMHLQILLYLCLMQQSRQTKMLPTFPDLQFISDRWNIINWRHLLKVRQMCIYHLIQWKYHNSSITMTIYSCFRLYWISASSKLTKPPYNGGVCL